MKYKIGDLILVKEIHLPPRFPLPLPRRFRLRLPPRFRLRPHLLPHLKNTFGIITAFEKHSDIFESGSTENDNGYILYSQVDNKEYY